MNKKPAMKKFIIYLTCFFFLITTAIVFAEIKSLIKEYSYLASELDNQISCRAIALEQVKQELLEELGTYVQSTTVVQDLQIQKDEIKTLTAGVVQTKILDEKWDGRKYWLKAQVSADPAEVAQSIEKLKKDDKLAQELAESKAEKEAALLEVDRLKAELAQANSDSTRQVQYNQAVNQLQASDSFEQGSALTVAGNYEEAAKAYDRSIELRPNDAKAYFNRSVVYIYLGNYNRAAADINRAMILQPANTDTYYRRAVSYNKNIKAAGQVQLQSGNQPGKQRQLTSDQFRRFLDWKQKQYRQGNVQPQILRPQVKEVRQPSRQAERINERAVQRQPLTQEVIKEGQPPVLRLEGDRQPALPERKVPQRRELTEEQRKQLAERYKAQKQQPKQEARKDRPVLPPRLENNRPVQNPAQKVRQRREMTEEQRKKLQQEKSELPKGQKNYPQHKKSDTEVKEKY
jgi:tetratricopeptide (TPR) repeat protein